MSRRREQNTGEANLHDKRQCSTEMFSRRSVGLLPVASLQTFERPSARSLAVLSINCFIPVCSVWSATATCMVVTQRVYNETIKRATETARLWVIPALGGSSADVSGQLVGLICQGGSLKSRIVLILFGRFCKEKAILCFRPVSICLHPVTD
jgi:hypothetical protein